MRILQEFIRQRPTLESIKWYLVEELGPTCWLAVGPLTVNSAVAEKIPADTTSRLATLDVLTVTGTAPLLDNNFNIWTRWDPVGVIEGVSVTLKGVTTRLRNLLLGFLMTTHMSISLSLCSV